MGSSNFILKTALEDDQILIPGTPPSPNSRVLKKLNADLMHLLLQVDIEERHFIMMVYITQIQTLLKDQAAFKKRMNELDDIKEKIKYMQLAPKNEERVRLNHAQIEVLKNLKEKIEQAIKILDQRIFDLEKKIDQVKREIGVLDIEINKSIERYKSLVKDEFSRENIERNFKEIKYKLSDGSELSVTPDHIYKIGEKLISDLNENPHIDLDKRFGEHAHNILNEDLNNNYAHLPPDERKAVVDHALSSEVINETLNNMRQEVNIFTQAKELKETKDHFTGKIAEQAELQVELEKLENNLAIAKGSKNNLEELLSVATNTLESGKSNPAVTQQIIQTGKAMLNDLKTTFNMDFDDLKSELETENKEEISSSFKLR